MSYGLNYGKIQGLVAKQDGMGSDSTLVSEARGNVTVLQGIRRRLTTARASMRLEGNKSHFALQ